MIERPLIIDYEIVRGLPGNVEGRVQNLIQQQNGWQPKGNSYLMSIDGCEVLIQCMVKYDEQ